MMHALRGFMINHGDRVPAIFWAGNGRLRIDFGMHSVDVLIQAFRGDKEQLGWLAHPQERYAWEFCSTGASYLIHCSTSTGGCRTAASSSVRFPTHCGH